MRRFYSPLPEDPGTLLELSADIRRHLTRVLRQLPGSRFQLFDGRGRIARCRLAEDGAQAIIEQLDKLEPPDFGIELIQGLAKGEKLDMVLQKGCELGVQQVSLTNTERAVIKLNANKADARMARWEKIAQEACRQCGQPFIPTLAYRHNLPQALEMASGELKLVLWEDAHRPLREILPAARPQSISLLIGPEGGFSAEEVRRAEAAGFQAARLGPRILRTETAGLAILSILQYLYGDLDSNVNSFSSPAQGKDMS